MIPVVRQDILAVLKGAEDAVLRKDISELKELSGHTVHNSSIFQDEDSIGIAVLIYSLSKVCERGSINFGLVARALRHARKHLRAGQVPRYKAVFRKIAQYIAQNDDKFSIYVQDVIDKAEVKKGSRLYYHGISLAQAASLLGVTQWELMNYVGKTQVHEIYEPIRSVRDRLELARRLFR